MLIVGISNFLSHRFFPNRHYALHFVYEPLAGSKALAPVGPNHFHPKRSLFDFDDANAVDHSYRFNAPTLFHLIEEQIKLVLNHALEGFVLNRLYTFSLLGPTDDA